MKLITSGEVNPYYVQTLCLIFFPGAKFAEDEEITNETPVVTVDAQNTDDGVQAKVSIRIGDHITFGDAFVPYPTKKATVSVPKVAVGKAFSAAAEEFFGYLPAWGILTGIRPSKISGQIYREGYTPAQVGTALDGAGICVRSGLHCAPLAHRTLGTGENGAVRASFGYFNTVVDVRRLADEVYRLTKGRC